MYTGYNSLVSELLDLKKQKEMQSQMDSLQNRALEYAKLAAAAKKSGGGGGGGMSGLDAQLKGAQLDKMSDERSAAWDKANNASGSSYGGGGGGSYGASRYNAEDNAAQNSKEENNSTPSYSGGSNSGYTSNQDDSNGSGESSPSLYSSDGGSGSSGGGTSERRGGPVRAGHLYHVAEGNKPEMLVPQNGSPEMLNQEQSIVPQQDGNIIPNDKLQAMVRARLNGAPQAQQAPQGDPNAAAMKLRMMSMMGGQGGR